MRVFITLVILTSSLAGFAQWGGGEKYPDLKPHPKSMEAFEDMRFGIFVHWGPSIMRGTSSWGRGNHPYDFAPKVPISEFDSLYLQFNPVLFDADDWIGTVKASGANYFVITSKHHDGFCIFNSAYTDYDIMSTPYSSDVLMELSKACERHGILFGTYYSICDWHHPEYPGRYGGDPRPSKESDMDLYKEYLYHQMDELVDTYDSKILWFDGSWESPWKHEDGMDLYKYLRDKNDELIINNRVDKKQNLKQRPDLTGKFAGDFKTPEQEIGEYENELPWESCITITDRGWHFNPQSRVKSFSELIHTLVQTAGGGGNLLLNISPMPDGRIEMFQKKRLLDMGRWLEKYGRTIYQTDGGPFAPNEFAASTRCGNEIFIHLLDWPGDVLRIPKFEQRIRSISLFDGVDLNLVDAGEYWEMSIPEPKRNPVNTVIRIEIEGEVEDIRDLAGISFIDLKTAKLQLEPAEKFPGQGSKTLVNRKEGSSNNLYAEWIAFEGENCEAVIDLGRNRSIHGLEVGCLSAQSDWIFLPQKIAVLASTNDISYHPVGEKSITIDRIPERKRVSISVPVMETEARYLKVTIQSIKKCPDWHKGAGGKAWIFIDEIEVNQE